MKIETISFFKKATSFVAFITTTENEKFSIEANNVEMSSIFRNWTGNREIENFLIPDNGIINPKDIKFVFTAN